MPIWLVKLALGGLGWVEAVLKWIVDHPAEAFAVISFLVAVWQTHRLHKTETAFSDFKVATKTASDKNAEEQKKLNQQLDLAYTTVTEKTNAVHEADTAKNKALAELYRLRNRVYLTPTNSGSSTETASSDIASVSLEATPGAVLGVAITDTDYNNCTADYTYANSAYKWAQQLIAEGAAKFDGN